MAAESHRRYREIMRDIEGLVNDHSMPSKTAGLALLVLIEQQLLAIRQARRSDPNCDSSSRPWAGSLPRYFSRKLSWSKIVVEPFPPAVS
jgi:hypothetical protein